MNRRGHRRSWRSRTGALPLLATLVLVPLVLGACGDDDTMMPEACGEDTPLVTWETFGQGFLSTYCQGCHASTTLDRQGAPAAVTFDTEQEAFAWREQILTVAATGETLTMPPNGGPSEADRERLTVWLTCFAE